MKLCEPCQGYIRTQAFQTKRCVRCGTETTFHMGGFCVCHTCAEKDNVCQSCNKPLSTVDASTSY